MTQSELSDVLECLLTPDYDVMNVELKGKRVLLRADLNVPLDKAGSISDDSRAVALLPTLKELSAKGAKVIIASHLGRPQPRRQSLEEMKAAFSLAPVDKLLCEYLGSSLYMGMAESCIGESASAMINKLHDGQICLLENTRFHAGDTSNDPAFAEQLAKLCDIFINDAFGVVHRDQASVTGVAKFVEDCYPGPLIRKELSYLVKNLDSPVRPLGVVIGGAKVADKIGVINALISKADKILVGGRMAFTFLAAQGVSIGATQIEEAWLEKSLEMLEAAKQKGCEIVLPQDVIVAYSLDAPDSEHPPQLVDLSLRCCTKEKPCIPEGKYGVDIGPNTADRFASEIAECSTIFWNGPMGRFEVPAFAEGTSTVARAMAKSYDDGRITVVGGGDSVSAINHMGLASHVSHISTGGGASLELIEGLGMPGLRALVGKCKTCNGS